MESFIGSVWFGGMAFLAGYFLGHVVPISRFIQRK